MQRRKRDYGTLRIEAIVSAGLAQFEAARTMAGRGQVIAAIVLGAFDDYYRRSRTIPSLAKRAFETKAWADAVALSQERIAIFSVALGKLTPFLRDVLSDTPDREGIWQAVETEYAAAVEKRYESDLALAFLAALRRALFHDIWDPSQQDAEPVAGGEAGLWREIAHQAVATPEMVRDILAVPGIAAPYRDLADDAARVAQRINQELAIGPERPLQQVRIIDAGFYRNKGAYIVGSITVAGETGPLALALLHTEKGVEVDAVILKQTTLTHVFSATLANFHVTVPQYHELVDCLKELMPSRPRGLHYTTVGYNHVGKIAAIRQLFDDLDGNAAPLDHAPGSRGSVAIGFTSPASNLVLKVIRDRPSAHYKWDKFPGIDAVLAKYHSVHELNRSGSMLDNIIYSNIALPRSMFAPELLAELLEFASQTVSTDGERVLFRNIIMQRKVVPLPIYLETCTQEDAEMVVIRLGQCIRNNAATNVFNKDLDGRNYGVSSLRFVYLFDYDALEELTEVKVRTNAGREDGEEDVPDWFFEPGVIFLPEELEMHLRLPDAKLRRLFREAHGELLTLDYWTRMQAWLREGRVPRVRTYPRNTQLRLGKPVADMTLTRL